MPQLIFKVVHQQYRPPLPADCTPGYVALMERCWQHDPKARPSASEVLEALREMLVQLRSGDASHGEGGGKGRVGQGAGQGRGDGES